MLSNNFELLDIRFAEKNILQKIREHLSNDQQLLWLTAGGSNVNLATKIRQGLDFSKGWLVFGLTDERYGPVGHPDSNWQKLIDSGFDFNNIVTVPVLNNQTIEACSQHFDSKLKQYLETCQFRMGLFGMGSDGHIAGILPRQTVTESDNGLVGYFSGPDFRRITILGAAVSQLDEAFLVAGGEAKWPMLKRLLQEDNTTEAIPAQLLKTAGRLTVYTDYKGE